jgi:hypothetical protein
MMRERIEEKERNRIVVRREEFRGMERRRKEWYSIN